MATTPRRRRVRISRERASQRERRCLITGESAEAAALVRFVIDPGGHVVPDIRERLPGRGYWVRAARDTVDEAVRRDMFAKAAARAAKGRPAKAAEDAGSAPRIVTDPGLSDQVERLLAEHCLGLLGLARRAGQVVTGFEKVADTLSADPAAVLITASDGSADGRGKLMRPGRKVIALFTRDELSLALGRENVVHAALTPAGIGKRLLAEAERLAGFRGRESDTGRGAA